MVAAGDQLAGLRLALQDEAGLRLVGRAGDRRVEQRLVGDGAAGLDAARAGDHEFRPRIVDAGGELRRGKAAEDDGMHGAEPGAGEHRENRLRHHRHVDDDAVALFDAEIHEHGGERLHFDEQLAVADAPLRAGDRAVVEDGRLVRALGGVAVDAVVAGVAFGADEPAAVDAERGVEDL